MKNRLRELREEKKLSLRELSELVGMSAAVLGNYERGDRQPKIEAWQKLADFFDVSTSYIMGISDERNELNDLLKNKINSMLNLKSSRSNDTNEEAQTTIFLEILIQELTKFISIIISNNDMDFQLQTILGIKDFIQLMSAMNEEFDYKKIEELSNHLSFLKDLYTGELFFDFDENDKRSLQSSVKTNQVYLSNKETSNHIFDKTYLNHLINYYD